MTINERVSPKRLAEIIARAEVCDDSVLTDYRDIESIARELQQYRAAAEPVAFRWRWKDDGMNKPGEWIYHDMMHFEAINRQPTRECQLVYAAPQVTSVPDEVPESLKDRLLTICDIVEDNDEYCQDIWNACRGAMLGDGTLINEGTTAAPAVQAEQLSGNTEHVSQPTLPLDYLQGYKDGCEWSALMAEANHPQTGDWLFDDPIELAKAIRKGPDMLPAAPKQEAL